MLKREWERFGFVFCGGLTAAPTPCLPSSSAEGAAIRARNDGEGANEQGADEQQVGSAAKHGVLGWQRV